MYVLPFSMGDLKSPFAKVAVQVTDSSFVAANMKIMTRLGKDVGQESIGLLGFK